MSDTALHWLADLVLLVHALFVLAVVGGVVVVWIGAWREWRWVRKRWLRSAHLAAIVFVAGSAVLGWACPLTVLEDLLRSRTPGATGCIERWVGMLLYYSAPAWVFTALYVGFAAVVAATWYWVRPTPRRSR